MYAIKKVNQRLLSAIKAFESNKDLLSELLVWKCQDEVNGPDEGLCKTEAVVQKMWKTQDGDLTSVRRGQPKPAHPLFPPDIWDPDGKRLVNISISLIVLFWDQIRHKL